MRCLTGKMPIPRIRTLADHRLFRGERRGEGQAQPDLLGLGEHFPFSFDVVPNDEAIEVRTACEKDSTSGAFAEPMGKSNIFFRLRPTGNHEHVDSDPLAGTQHSLAHRCLFGYFVRRIDHVQHLSLIHI